MWLVDPWDALRFGAFLRRISVLALVVGFCGACESTHAPQFGARERVPDIEFLLPDGSVRKLSDYRGKVVLLNFWASWCGDCKKAIPSLNRLHEKLSSEGFVVLGVAVRDTDNGYRAALTQFRFPYVVGFEKGVGTAELFKMTGVPETFLIDRDGRFALMVDPASSNVASRILGPREWDSEFFVSQFRKLL